LAQTFVRSSSIKISSIHAPPAQIASAKSDFFKKFFCPSLSRFEKTIARFVASAMIDRADTSDQRPRMLVIRFLQDYCRGFLNAAANGLLMLDVICGLPFISK
jgi:hypothetical protein